MKVVISRTGGRTPSRRSRGGLEDLVGLAELTVLPLELLHPCTLLGRQTRPLAAIDLGLLDPIAQGLRADAELAGDPGQRAERGGRNPDSITRPVSGTRDQAAAQVPSANVSVPLPKGGRRSANRGAPRILGRCRRSAE